MGKDERRENETGNPDCPNDYGAAMQPTRWKHDQRLLLDNDIKWFELWRGVEQVRALALDHFATGNRYR